MFSTSKTGEPTEGHTPSKAVIDVEKSFEESAPQLPLKCEKGVLDYGKDTTISYSEATKKCVLTEKSMFVPPVVLQQKSNLLSCAQNVDKEPVIYASTDVLQDKGAKRNINVKADGVCHRSIATNICPTITNGDKCISDSKLENATHCIKPKTMSLESAEETSLNPRGIGVDEINHNGSNLELKQSAKAAVVDVQLNKPDEEKRDNILVCATEDEGHLPATKTDAKNSITHAIAFPYMQVRCSMTYFKVFSLFRRT